MRNVSSTLQLPHFILHPSSLSQTQGRLNPQLDFFAVSPDSDSSFATRLHRAGGAKAVFHAVGPMVIERKQSIACFQASTGCWRFRKHCLDIDAGFHVACLLADL